jgi:queuine/archaeosine tRNA-ribosyltransferase
VGLGGMVPLLQRRRALTEWTDSPEAFIARTLALIRREFDSAMIHVFGAGGTRTFPAVFAFGADSADSIGWRHAAGFGSVFLPLKSQRVIKWDRSKNPPRRCLDPADLADIERCGCPICRTKSNLNQRLAALRRSFYNRSIHNAWIVSNQFEFWPRSRRELLSLVSRGGLGVDWAEASRHAV